MGFDIQEKPELSSGFCVSGHGFPNWCTNLNTVVIMKFGYAQESVIYIQCTEKAEL